MAPAGMLIVALLSIHFTSMFTCSPRDYPKRRDHGRTPWNVYDDDANECFETRTWVPYKLGGLRDFKTGQTPLSPAMGEMNQYTCFL